MRLKQQITHLASGELFFLNQFAQGEKIPQRLAHLLPLDHQMRAVQPVFHEPFPRPLHACALTLGDFILVMRKNQVLAAEVQVKARPKDLHAHRAALDVPARPALAPGTRPEHLAILRRARFPEGEIGDGFLRVFVAAHAFARSHFIEIQLHQLPVLAAAAAILFDAEIDRTVRSFVGSAAGDQFIDQRNDVADVPGRARGVLRTAAAERVEVFEKFRLVSGRVFLARAAGLADALDDFVLHIRDVHHVGEDVTLEFQIAPDQVGEDECPEIADVREVVHRRPAAVQADLFAGRVERNERLRRTGKRERREFLDRTRQGVEKSQTHVANGAVA